jgi:hypothetical protein
MANTNVKLHGKDAAIYLGGTFATASTLPSGAVKVASKTEWTLQRNRDYVDATVFGDTNKTYLAGLPNVQGTFAGLLDVSGDLLLNAATSAATMIYLYADDGTNGGTIRCVAHGLGFVDATVNATNTDALRYSGEYRAAAAWTIDLATA